MKVLVARSCPTLCDPMDSWTPTRVLSPWNFPGKNPGVGCIFFSRGSSHPRDWTQELNPILMHCKQILYHLSHQGLSEQDKDTLYTLKNMLEPQKFLLISVTSISTDHFRKQDLLKMSSLI